ncbi:hypothetical protein CBOM_07523 [Ceraceosorus bombacis]|uniref:Uncharacterized protein n=1 Tax=Ceraceosorus bombacis TaxID=401625 RepID=A0A0P1BFP5_9BASI|nr:hypothetical protein CBOM_07523 [Ceraceosorus bombacis]
MAGPSHSAPSTNRWYAPKHNFAPHRPAFHHRWGAKLLGGFAAFFILYRIKQDGASLIGHHSFHDHHGDDHGHDEHH